MQRQEDQPGQVWQAPELIELGDVGSATQLGGITFADGVTTTGS
ncbi:hypothetical protein ABHF91_00590 [Pseudaeromonas sp. ZJS20]